jgi:adenylosuccinate synthase
MDVLVGLQYGDEGKGKITDYLSKNYSIVARFQGGDNAGHTIIKNEKKIVLHTLPSGVLQENVINFLGNGMVINPISLKKEIQQVQKIIPDVKERIFISENASIIIPSHVKEEENENIIDTTKKGIGPCYRDKTERKGFKVKHIEKLKNIYSEEFDSSLDFLETLNISSDNLKNQHLPILAEGAQGTMLDIDHGDYPFVTSSNTISAGACIGLGMPPQSIKRVYGVFKCYLTRVGNGNFPTEMNPETSKKIRHKGGEFGATTGRNRKCGWLNLDQLKESIKLNGVTDLVMTKVDVLSSLERIYLFCEGEYHGFEPWESVSISDENFYRFINFLENFLKEKIKLVSYSPKKEDIKKLN